MIEVGKTYRLRKLRVRSKAEEGRAVTVSKDRGDDTYTVVAADGGLLAGCHGMVVSSRQLGAN